MGRHCQRSPENCGPNCVVRGSTGSALKVCFVLQRHDPQAATHHAYLSGMVEQLGPRIRARVIFESAADRSRIPPRLDARVQKFRNPVMRGLELAALLLRARFEGFRIFYVHYSYYGGIIGGTVARLTRATCLYWSCGLFSPFFLPLRPTWRSFREKWRTEWSLRLTLRLVDHLVTGTPTMAEIYSRDFALPRESVRLLPNSIDVSRFAIGQLERSSARERLEIPAKSPLLLFVHRLSRRKGAHFLPQIYESLAMEYTDLVLLVVGDGPLRGELTVESRRPEFARMRILGPIPNAEIAQVYAAADILLVPSLEEGFPRVLLESMAGGCPFVVTDVGGVRDVLSPIQRTHCLAPASDLSAFVSLVRRLIEDVVLRERLRRDGLDSVNAYDRQTVARQLASLLRDSS